MATIPTTVLGQAGTVITFQDAAAGDQCATGPDVKLLVQNSGASSVDVIIDTPGKVDGDLDIADRTFTVPAGATSGIPVTDRYRNPATGLASVTYTATTSVQVAVIR